MENSNITLELERLNAQIEPLQETVIGLETELRKVESELEAFEIDQQQIEILRNICSGLDQLRELGSDALFWDGLPADTAEHRARLQARIDGFGDQTGDLEAKKIELQEKIEQHLSVLDFLFDEVQQAQAREERRLEEFAVVREETPLPFRPLLMPWSMDATSERRFRKALLISFLWCLLLGGIIPLVNLPIPDRELEEIKIPERMAMLLKEAEPLPLPPPPVEKAKEPEKTESEKPKPKPDKPAPGESKEKPKEAAKKQKVAPKPAAGDKRPAPKKVRNVGVLAFKSSFKDLMDEVPVAKLGTEARVKQTQKVPGQARTSRSLVAMQAQGGSGKGISNFGVSRNLGNGGSGGGSGYGNAGQIGGLGTGQVESVVSGLTEEAGRPLSDGVGPARTDEEIQIVFDRYKATLYRIYNKELRKDPSLRGKLLLKLTIEPGGEVSFCEVESTDLGSETLVKSIVARVRRFNFGPKEGVPPVTILYPIDFLPAG